MIRRPDVIGLLLLIGIAAALLGGGAVLVASGVVKGWELALIVGFGGVLVAAAHPRPHGTTPQNALVHGAARPAAETETQAAARGAAKTEPMHDATFQN